MKKAYLTVCSNQQIADRVYQMVLKGSLSKGLQPRDSSFILK